jgi:high-affinity nickel-transport protein
VGNIVGTAVSALFLIVLCAGNAWVLHRLICRLRAAIVQQQGGTAIEENEPIYSGVNEDEDDDDDDEVRRLAAGQQFTVEGGGILTTLLRRLFKAIDRPWKMYPLGFVFGLGFDTSSEIAILGIASIQAVQGTSIWLILLFPILFTGTFPASCIATYAKYLCYYLILTSTAGMCLLDTTDGALMLALYTSKAFSRDPVAILYYSAVLTAITVVVSAFIGVVQVLSLIQNVAEPDGPFWDGVEAIGDYFDVIGGCICGIFLLVGLGSIAVYGPWRRRMERRSREQDQEGRYVINEPTGNPEEGESPTQRTPLIAHTDPAGRGT